MSEIEAEMDLIPRPASIRQGARGGYRLSDKTVIISASELASVADNLRDLLRPATGFGLPVNESHDTVEGREPDGADSQNAIRLQFDGSIKPEAFRFESSDAGILLCAGSESGAFYACQALLQLLPPAIYRRALVSGVVWEVPGVIIDDAPRYGWRGLMVDVARHFLPKAGLLRIIDLAAMHRLNTVHLHLTDDQGWRIEIKAYPRLTEIGSWRRETKIGMSTEAPYDGRPHGGFYTQDDLREIVSYAAARHITVLPEVDMPGHVQAVLAAYPEFGAVKEPVEVSPNWGISKNVLNLKDETIQFVRDVFDEVIEIFPSKHIGIGGDECPKDQWREDPETQAHMAELGINTEDELQAWFIRQVTEHLRARGRVAFGWDEVLEGEPPENLVVASWRGLYGAREAARLGIDTVSMPCDEVYLDYRQSEDPNDPSPIGHPNTTERIFGFDPVPSALSESEVKHVLGGQATIWAEHIYTWRELDLALFPRLAAFADAIWAGPDSGGTGMERLERHLHRLDAIGVEYCPIDGANPWQRKPGVLGLRWTREEHAQHMTQLTANIVRPTERNEL